MCLAGVAVRGVFHCCLGEERTYEIWVVCVCVCVCEGVLRCEIKFYVYLQIELVESGAGEVPLSGRSCAEFTGRGLVCNSVCERHHCSIASG